MLLGWTTFIKKHWAERQLRIKQNQYKFRELSDFNYFKSENIKIAEDDRNSDSQMVNKAQSSIITFFSKNTRFRLMQQ